MTSQEELDAKLKAVLTAHDATECPQCGHGIGWGDIAWNNRSTEEGTDYSVVQITCLACDSEIAHITSWHGIDDTEDLIYVLETDW